MSSKEIATEEKEDDKPFSMKAWFDRTQTAYSAWEDRLWDRLGGFGAWMKKRRSRKVPDWKRVQQVWIGISILALITGWNVGGFYYEHQCNKHIIEEFYPEVACLNGLKCDMERVNPELMNMLNNSLMLNDTIKDLPLLGKAEAEIG